MPRSVLPRGDDGDGGGSAPAERSVIHPLSLLPSLVRCRFLQLLRLRFCFCPLRRTSAFPPQAPPSAWSPSLTALPSGCSHARCVIVPLLATSPLRLVLHLSPGVRLVDDFLAKSKAPPCASFADTADVVAKVAFKMFLGVPALVGSWSSDRRTFSLVFTDNPLAEFTELPEKWGGVWYSNVLCGVIKGALEMVRPVASFGRIRDVGRIGRVAVRTRA